ncbi:hypothetical protein LSUE1_G002980 [Lachnellula suecica]|uniref:Uncharacterized protein n=1 Tax=Lachnellula suecica TaxID=602035 RepID=A0A8T9CIS3_9HELO|nr:hypothetical protein LSUE1_G002980 [Lachnellula suecica]
MNTKLKPNPELFSCPQDLRSDTLVVSPVSSNASPRTFYLKNPALVSPPLISASEFVPRNLIVHLMRNKKDSALAIKFVPNRKYADGRSDEVTNMEGAIHTFVTPVVPAVMVGDYAYNYGHGVVKFGNEKGKREVRNVVFSASVQMDFEFGNVMLKLSRLQGTAVHGQDYVINDEWDILSAVEKQDQRLRLHYDDRLRKHMVYHLTKAHLLPARSEIDVRFCMNVDRSIVYLEELITTKEPNFIANIENTIYTRFTQLDKDVIVSLELLFNTAIHQARNEISALESICPQGYVYTYDPPSIFARMIEPSILNRLLILALKYLSHQSTFDNMKVFGFNDYADSKALSLVREALERQSDVVVCSKSDLFKGDGGLYDLEEVQRKNKDLGKGAMLVVHNNSDAFGQNIETEPGGGSLDGAIGANSSGAASLGRGRKDLVDWIF